MMFFEADDGCRYPVASIRRIGRLPSEYGTKPDSLGRTPPVRVMMEDGEFLNVGERLLRAILRLPVHVWSALPETYALHIGHEDGKPLAHKTPIVGWAITHEGFILPITPDGVNDGLDDNNLLVMTPDGTVTEPYVRLWPSLEACLADHMPVPAEAGE